jgi:hypothetical protein
VDSIANWRVEDWRVEDWRVEGQASSEGSNPKIERDEESQTNGVENWSCCDG